jgi:phospholipid-transporting ATPase
MRRLMNNFKFGENSDKPPSKPIGWPNSTEEDISDRPKRLIKVGGPQNFTFCNNFVKTSKYEFWSFLPKFLLEEFNPKTKVANCYFLMISGLQCIPDISNTGGLPTTLLPLLFVVMVDGIFQIIEDISRHKADTAANSSITHRFDLISQTFTECKWSELAVGDFIRINTRCSVPADVVILAVAEKTDPPQGIAYVETKSLDGETNLKIRTALPLTLAKVPSNDSLSWC